MQITLEYANFYVVVFQELAKRIGSVEVEIGGRQQPALNATLLELPERFDQDLKATVCNKRYAKVKRAAGRELLLDNG